MESSECTLKLCTQMKARVEKVDVLGWTKSYQPPPPGGAPLAYFAQHGIPVPMTAHTGGGGWTHYSSNPNHIPT